VVTHGTEGATPNFKIAVAYIVYVPEDKVQAFLPSLYVLYAASLAKLHTIEQLNTEFIGYNVNVAIVSETHLKKKHANSGA